MVYDSLKRYFADFQFFILKFIIKKAFDRYIMPIFEPYWFSADAHTDKPIWSYCKICSYFSLSFRRSSLPLFI